MYRQLEKFIAIIQISNIIQLYEQTGNFSSQPKSNTVPYGLEKTWKWQNSYRGTVTAFLMSPILPK